MDDDNWNNRVTWATSRPMSLRKIPAAFLLVLIAVLTEAVVQCDKGVRRLYGGRRF